MPASQSIGDHAEPPSLGAVKDDVCGLLADHNSRGLDEDTRDPREHAGVDDPQTESTAYPELTVQYRVRVARRANLVRATRMVAPGAVLDPLLDVGIRGDVRARVLLDER
jgi:hypothetical protein